MPATSVRPRPVRTPTLRRLLWRLRRPAAAVCAGFAVLLVVGELRSPGPATTATLVAAHDIAAGTALTDGDLTLADLPSSALPDGSTASPDGLIAATTAVAIPAGLPLVPELLAPELSTAPAGDVVVPVRFADSALTDLLTPGTRLDVVAADPGAPPRTVASNVLVLARAATTAPQSGGGLLGSGTDSTDSPVLLAVDPRQAVELSAASASTGLTAILVE